jgi:hypothetical protein
MAMKKCDECNTEISSKAEQCPKCGVKAKKKTSFLTWVFTIIIGLGIFGYISGHGGGSAATAASSTGSSGPTPSSAQKNTKLDFTWKKAGFDNIMQATFTITNTNAFPVKDIEVLCEHSANSGTVIDSNRRTIYDIVPANGKRTFKDFDMGFIHSQASKTSCGIESLKL